MEMIPNGNQGPLLESIYVYIGKHIVPPGNVVRNYNNVFTSVIGQTNLSSIVIIIYIIETYIISHTSLNP